MDINKEIQDNLLNQRMHILKGFSDYDENALKKSEDDTLEKAKKFDTSTQKTYADNSKNQQLNRVGQTYGGRNVDEPSGDGQKKPEEDSKGQRGAVANKPGEKPSTEVKQDEKQPQEVQPNQEYGDDQLNEFATSAEDWQLEEFINDAKKSGDNSEYMQKQMNIAQTELNNRRGVSNEEGAEGVDGESQEGIEGEEQGDGSGLPDFNDNQAVKQFLAENPQIRERMLEIVEEDVFVTVKDAIKIANAETRSGSDALQHVEEAKRTLDELHAKLGGGGDLDSMYDSILETKEKIDNGDDSFTDDLKQKVEEFKSAGGHVEDWMMNDESSDDNLDDDEVGNGWNEEDEDSEDDDEQDWTEKEKSDKKNADDFMSKYSEENSKKGEDRISEGHSNYGKSENEDNEEEDFQHKDERVNQLPEHLKSYAGNDPDEFFNTYSPEILDFISDEDNFKKVVEMGLNQGEQKYGKEGADKFNKNANEAMSDKKNKK